MLYFKSEKLNNLEASLIEKSLRRFSSKKHLNLDLKRTSSSLIQEDSRYFLGVENKSYLKITRLRTPFEEYFPKLIVRFSKSNFQNYSVRFSIIPFIIALLIIGGLINDIVKSIASQTLSSRLLLNAFFFLLLIVLTSLELKFTKKRIIKAITNTKEV